MAVLSLPESNGVLGSSGDRIFIFDTNPLSAKVTSWPESQAVSSLEIPTISPKEGIAVRRCFSAMTITYRVAVFLWRITIAYFVPALVVVLVL